MEAKLTMDAEVTIEQNSTPGELLREARLQKGMSQKQIADRIRIKAAWVKQIEEDDYSHAAAFIYLKGYLSAYAREVDIPPQQVLAAFSQMEYAEHLLPKSFLKDKKQWPKHIVSFKKSNSKNSRLILRGGLLLLLALTVLMVILWWEGEHKSLMTYFKPTTPDLVTTPESVPLTMSLPHQMSAVKQTESKNQPKK